MIARNKKFGNRTVNRNIYDKDVKIPIRDKKIKKIKEKYTTGSVYDTSALEKKYKNLNKNISYNDVIEKITDNINISNTHSKYMTVSPNRGITEIEPLLAITNAYGGFICGGYATYCASRHPSHIKPTDIDIYCRNEESYNTICNEFKYTKSYGSFKISVTPFFTTFRFFDDYELTSPFAMLPALQIVNPNIYKNIYGRPDASIDNVIGILNNFDFTICRAAIIDKKNILVDERWIVDEENKNIRISNLTKPIGLFSRVIKYISKGYKIDPPEILKLFVFWDSFDESSKKSALNFLLELTKIQLENDSKEEDKIEESIQEDDATNNIFNQNSIWGNITKGPSVDTYSEIFHMLKETTRKELGYKYDVFAQHVIFKKVEKEMCKASMIPIINQEYIAKKSEKLENERKITKDTDEEMFDF